MYRYLRLIDQVMPFLLPESKFTTHINLIIFPTVPQDYYNTYYPKIFKNCSVSGMLVKNIFLPLHHKHLNNTQDSIIII